MANISEVAQWDSGVYQIEEVDPVQGGPDGIDNKPHKNLANRSLWLKQQYDALNSEIVTARGGKANLDARLDALETQTLQGESTFNSTSGKTVSHSLGHVNYMVNIIPIADTGGDLGDVFINKAANAFTVYNTGGFMGAFRYQIIT
ncbi:MAG: hypothetical protein PWQ93_654 [Clostridiales bacterium]|jgi:hypothetical protein|nr:hypothetical protein [Clostridiales bacterium]